MTLINIWAQKEVFPAIQAVVQITVGSGHSSGQAAFIYCSMWDETGDAAKEKG